MLVDLLKNPNESVFHIRCHYCLKIGHKANRCRKRQKDQQDTSKKKSTDSWADWVKYAKCYKCSRRGHLAKDCRIKDSSKEKHLCH